MRAKKTAKPLRSDFERCHLPPATKRDKRIAEIISALGYEATEMRNVDSLDFREISVAMLKQALEAAYASGEDDARGVSRDRFGNKLYASYDRNGNPIKVTIPEE